MIKKDVKINGVSLEYFEKNPSASKTVVLTPALTSNVLDYENILGPLSEMYHIIAYNMRGHGNSEGVFSFKTAIADLEKIVENEGDVRLLGHSLGAAISSHVASAENLNAYLINPYCGFNFLPWWIKVLIGSFSRMPVGYMDALLDSTPSVKKQIGRFFNIDFNNNNSLQGYAELARAAPPQATQAAVAFAISDRDVTLGTKNPMHHYRLREFMQGAFPNSIDYSDTVVGLNHSLNRTDLVPFMADDNPRLLNSIREFFS